MMANLAMTEEPTDIVRPLKVLVPLIKEDLARAKEAADRASEPYYLAAGQKMIEAKGQMDHGEFEPWLKRHFNMTPQWARQYMRLARTTDGIENESARSPTISGAIRASGGAPRGAERGGAAWHEPVRDAIEKASHIKYLHDESLKRAEERELERKLATQLIDIGFKALAAKLHPDKGGSREAMARLNKIRDHLRRFV